MRRFKAESSTMTISCATLTTTERLRAVCDLGHRPEVNQPLYSDKYRSSNNCIMHDMNVA